MAIIRDVEGKVYNIPDGELARYAVPVASSGTVAVSSGTNGGGHPAMLCLEPTVGNGGHDGWSYAEAAALPVS